MAKNGQKMVVQLLFMSQFHFESEYRFSNQGCYSSICKDGMLKIIIESAISLAKKLFKSLMWPIMPCPYTGPKMFCNGPNFLCQTKTLFTNCGTNILCLTKR